MWLIGLAWKNMWRNRTRTAITMAAVFFAVILSVLTSSLKDGIFDNLIKNVVSFYTGYVQVHKAGYQDEQVLDNSLVYNSEFEGTIIAESNITNVSPRLETYSLVASGNQTRGCLVVGIDPEKEDKVTGLKSKITQGAYLGQNDKEVILSEGLSQKLKAGTGDTIYLIGQGYHGATSAGRYTVKGLAKFGSPELNNSIIYLSLPNARELYSAESLATSAVLSLADASMLDYAVTRLQNKLGSDYEVLSWEMIMPDVKQHIESDSKSMKYIQGVLYMLVSFGIFGTLLMMMVERKYELGMLIAIGMKKGKLCLLMAIESIFTVLAGCILGLAASIPVVQYFHHKPLRMGGETAAIYERFGFEAVFPTSTAADNFIYQGITVLIIGLILSLYPVYKVISTDPVKAMKR